MSTKVEGQGQLALQHRNVLLRSPTLTPTAGCRARAEMINGMNAVSAQILPIQPTPRPLLRSLSEPALLISIKSSGLLQPLCDECARDFVAGNVQAQITLMPGPSSGAQK
ncbi:hypothetical protein SRHO_G00317210 [Serrasalmus rhombeus]